jgi:putative endonuclease
MYYVYVLQSLKDGKLYTGYTDDLVRRLKEHNGGYSKSTKSRRPFKLVYSEKYQTAKQAAKREWYFKNTTEGDKLKRKIVSKLI